MPVCETGFSSWSGCVLNLARYVERCGLLRSSKHRDRLGPWKLAGSARGGKADVRNRRVAALVLARGVRMRWIESGNEVKQLMKSFEGELNRWCVPLSSGKGIAPIRYVEVDQRGVGEQAIR